MVDLPDRIAGNLQDVFAQSQRVVFAFSFDGLVDW